MTGFSDNPLCMVEVAASMVWTAIEPGGGRMPAEEAFQWLEVLHDFARVGARVFAAPSFAPGHEHTTDPADAGGVRP